MFKTILAAVLAFASLALAASSTAAQGESCFYPTQWTNWTAPNDHTIYLRVGARVFRVDTAGSCTGLRQGATLITRSHSAQLCRAIDWDLKVNNGGIVAGCIVANQTQLTPDQIAALPKGVRP